MYIIYTIISIIALFVVFVFLVPVELEIKIGKKGNKIQSACHVLDKKVDNKVYALPNRIVIKLFKKIPILKIDIDKLKVASDKSERLKNENKDKYKSKENPKINAISLTKVLSLIIMDKEGKLKAIKKDLSKYTDKVYLKKFVVSFGFNTDDYIRNAYINASLNSIICLYINHKRKSFNFNSLYYQIHISDYRYYLYADCILRGKLADTIYIMKKLFIFVKEELEVDGKKEEEKRWNSIQ